MNDNLSFDDASELVPAVGFDYPDEPEATPCDLDSVQRELLADALRLQHHRGFCEGETAAEVAVIDRVMSGRPSKNAILTRIIALARKHGRITTAAAVRLTGKTDRALRKAFPKVPPLAQGSTR